MPHLRVTQVHWDGAKDKDAVLLIMGEGWQHGRQ
jgi:hypothetical protein